MSKRVKVELVIDEDVGLQIHSLSKMFMMTFDDAINLVLKLEMKKRIKDE